MQYSLSIEQVGTEIRTVHELLGHSKVSTTMIYIHVLKVAEAEAEAARRARWTPLHMGIEGPLRGSRT